MTARTLTVPRLIPALLAGAAGVVDACTFLALFGLFVAQVTGSFVIVGAQLIEFDPSALIRTLAIPTFFMAGGLTAFLVAVAEHPRRALAFALAVEIALLGGFVAVGLVGTPFVRPDTPLAVTAGTLGIAAMGMQSALVRLMLRDTPSTNVMTTNMTQVAIDLAQWLAAARRAQKRPGNIEAETERQRARERLAMLWPVIVGFLAGTVCGAVVFDAVGFWSPLISLGVLAGVMVWVLRAPPRG